MSLSREEYEALSPQEKQQFAAKATPKELAYVMANTSVTIQNHTPINFENQKIPFFKFSKIKLLKQEMERLMADGYFTEDDNNKLEQFAAYLGLDVKDIDKLRAEHFKKILEPIKERCSQTFHFTDEDQSIVNDLSKRYNATVTLEPTMQMCREIYLLEVKNVFAFKPMSSPGVILDSSELLYLTRPTQWHQLRSNSKGYGSASISMPTGLRGVRFRVGESVPIRSEEITLLATGNLFVTSKRLLFSGDRRSTNITYTRIIGTSIYSDSVEVKKSTGKSDYFSMNPLEARYLSAIITYLKAS